MKNTQIRMAEIGAERDIAIANADLLAKFMSNPIVELIAGYVIVEYLQSHTGSHPIIPQAAGTVAEGAIVASVLLQQLSPSIPALAAAGGDIAGHIADVASRALGSGSIATTALALLPK